MENNLSPEQEQEAKKKLGTALMIFTVVCVGFYFTFMYDKHKDNHLKDNRKITAPVKYISEFDLQIFQLKESIYSENKSIKKNKMELLKVVRKNLQLEQDLVNIKKYTTRGEK